MANGNFRRRPPQKQFLAYLLAQERKEWKITPRHLQPQYALGRSTVAYPPEEEEEAHPPPPGSMSRMA
jgi:hypothetical protein